MKNSKSVAWLGIFQLLEISDVYTCLLVSKFQKFEGETRAEHFKKFSEGKLSRFNEYFLILPWNWKYFSVYSGRKDVAQLNEGREKDWKQIKTTLKKAAATKGTLASHIFFKTLFQTERNV